MKILGITILVMGLLTGFSLSMDLLLGLDLYTSVNNALNPFLVMEVHELVFFLFLVICLIAAPFRFFFRKKKEGSSKDKKQQQS